jgi:hypothetical protein
MPFDLAVANYYGNTVSILLGNGTGNGNGTFGPTPTTAETLFPAGPYPPDLTIGSFNNLVDATQDIVVSNYGGYVSFLPGNGDGTFGAPQFAPKTMKTAMSIGDGMLNAAAGRDVVVTDFVGNKVNVLGGDRNGGFGPPACPPAFPATGCPTGVRPLGLAVADLDANGMLDFVVTNQGSNNVQVFLQF